MSAAIANVEPDITEARIINWANWARYHEHRELSVCWSPEEGLYFPADRSESYGIPDTSGPEPHEADAAAVERVMVVLKGDTEEPKLYRAIVEYYVDQRHDISAARSLRLGVEEYLDLVARAVRRVGRELTTLQTDS